MSATIAMAPVRKSIRVKAARERAFEIFTQWRWWPKEHSILKSKSPQVSVTTEPRAGGRWYERGADGTECDWGKVLVWDPPARVVKEAVEAARRGEPLGAGVYDRVELYLAPLNYGMGVLRRLR